MKKRRIFDIEERLIDFDIQVIIQVAMDRGYNDYRLFTHWTDSGIYFVTRLKENADYVVVKEQTVPKNKKHFIGSTDQEFGQHPKLKATSFEKENFFVNNLLMLFIVKVKIDRSWTIMGYSTVSTYCLD